MYLDVPSYNTNSGCGEPCTCAIYIQQASNALFELVPLRTKMEEDIEQEEIQSLLPCTRVCAALQEPFTMITTTLNSNPGLTNDVVKTECASDEHFGRKKQGQAQHSNERQWLDEVANKKERSRREEVTLSSLQHAHAADSVQPLGYITSDSRVASSRRG
jgi:hypothetical protein